MPTGYTQPILDTGHDFKAFALGCARAFGACIEMRDDPADAPIPDEFKPSDCHLKQIEVSEVELARLKAMKKKERIAFGNAELSRLRAGEAEYRAKRKADNEKLFAVKANVDAWIPPTKDHHGLKKFMLDQIAISLNEIGEQAEDTRTPMGQWKLAVGVRSGSVQYHTKEHKEEVKRAADRTAWVKALRKSL